MGPRSFHYHLLDRLQSQFRATIEVDDEGIAWVPRRGERKKMRWADVESLREKRWAQRLEIHGRGERIIHVHFRIVGFEELRDIVLEKSNWENLFPKTLPVDLGRRVRVEPGRLIVKGLRRKIIDLEEAAFADVFQRNSRPQVMLEMKSGKLIRLPATGGRSLALLRAIRAAGPVADLKAINSAPAGGDPTFAARFRPLLKGEVFGLLFFGGLGLFMLIASLILLWHGKADRKTVGDVFMSLIVLALSAWILFLIKWRVDLDRTHISIHGILSREIPWSDVSSVSIARTGLGPVVALQLKSGKKVRLPRVREGSLALYRAVRARLGAA